MSWGAGGTAVRVKDGSSNSGWAENQGSGTTKCGAVRDCGTLCDSSHPALYTFPVMLYQFRSLKQAWHWHNKWFTPWYAIWRASEERTRDNVRGDVWECELGEIMRVRSWREFRNVENISRCHDELSCHFREQFVNYELTRRNATIEWQGVPIRGVSWTFRNSHHSLAHTTRNPRHTVASSCLIRTPNCVNRLSCKYQGRMHVTLTSRH